MEMKEFKERIIELSKRVTNIKDYVSSEEATKHALIMPFLQVLGYDIFNPQEVIPEFIADVGIKKGEKVDYAIFKDEKLSIIIECKTFGTDLNKSYYINQLYRYFSVSDVSVAILTNGEVYMFYTDVEEKNKMDQKPFMIFNMLNIQESLIPELKRLSKTEFDTNNIATSAMDLKYTKEIKNILKKELSSPTDEFMRYIISQVMPGKVRTSTLINMFSGITKLAFTQLIKEYVNNKLESMISADLQSTAETVSNTDMCPQKRESIRKISSFTFNKETYEVKTWREMLLNMCSLITILHPNTFMRLLELKFHFSTNATNLRSPKRIEGTDLYVSTNYSADSIEDLCKKIVELFGYDSSEFSVKE